MNHRQCFFIENVLFTTAMPVAIFNLFFDNPDSANA
jgi:hypothetical protein